MDDGCVFVPHIEAHYGIPVYVEISRDGEILHACGFHHSCVLADIVAGGHFAYARRVAAELDIRVRVFAADIDGS